MARSTLRGFAQVLMAGVVTAAAAAGGPVEGVSSSDAGRTLYREGRTTSGAPVQGSRDGHTMLQGAAVACVNCHRRSGLGAIEGRAKTPPIAGGYLFRERLDKASAQDLPYVDAMRTDRGAYTDATLARAIRDGLDADAKSLSYLMPRFDLADGDMASLIAYLKQLGPRHAPGVSQAEIHFATVVTPDADPVKRKGVLAVLERFFAERNQRQRAPSPQLVTSARTSHSQMMFRPQRQWRLHVWQLSGPEATWPAQLERYLAAEPVFAVISGLGGAHWTPVHEFCERAALPCLFPNVAAPPAETERSFYSLYFSRGVELEAALIAKQLPDRPDGGVLQVYRKGDAGQEGAAALAHLLQARGIPIRSRILGPDEAPGRGRLEFSDKASNAQTVVLWLRPDDLARLEAPPADSTAVYVSGLIGGLERAPLPAAWRERVRMAYPFDLPERRHVRVDFALGWFRAEHIDVVAPQEQIDTYLSCSLLSQTLNHMSDAMVRDYLLERIEDTIEHQVITGYYPRLTLGPSQRYASKGGYIVRLRPNPSAGVVAVGEWTVP